MSGSEETIEARIDDKIDLHATDAGLSYLAALHAVVPENKWHVGVRMISEALIHARAVPTTPEGITELREQYESVSARLNEVRAAKDHLESAARALGIEDESLLEKLVIEGLRGVTPKLDRYAERGQTGVSELFREYEKKFGHMGFFVGSGYDAGYTYEDVARANALDNESELGDEWIEPYWNALYIRSSDAPTGGGARRPSPAGIVTRMIWRGLGGALRQQFDTWSPVVGSVRLLDAYTPHKLTPKRFRQVIDAARDKHALVGHYGMKKDD